MKDFIIFILMGGIAVAVMVSCENSDWRKAEKAEDTRQAAAESKPHVIREADGCRVYAWKEYGTTHYFTRCAPSETVTTERHYIEACGKNCRKDKSETVVTQPQKKGL